MKAGVVKDYSDSINRNRNVAAHRNAVSGFLSDSLNFYYAL
jgi:hypothetical protein